MFWEGLEPGTFSTNQVQNDHALTNWVLSGVRWSKTMMCTWKPKTTHTTIKATHPVATQVLDQAAEGGVPPHSHRQVIQGLCELGLEPKAWNTRNILNQPKNRRDKSIKGVGLKCKGEVVKGWGISIKAWRSETKSDSPSSRSRFGGPPKIPPNCWIVFEVEVLSAENLVVPIIRPDVYVHMVWFYQLYF